MYLAMSHLIMVFLAGGIALEKLGYIGQATSETAGMSSNSSDDHLLPDLSTLLRP